MPSVSESQQRFMGMVNKCKETGDCSSEEVKDVAKSMKKKDVKDFARTKHKGLPKRVKRKKKAFSVLHRLISLANELDRMGFAKEADQLDGMIKELKNP
jgi:NADH:ubiquinone oxidoreductase subunit C